MKIEPLPGEPVVEVKALLYRTVQETLSNAARHSKATRVDVELRVEGERVVLTVTDNGVGFDVAQPVGGTGERGGRDRPTVGAGPGWRRPAENLIWKAVRLALNW